MNSKLVRANIIRPLLTAALALATTFTTSCGNHSFEEWEDILFGSSSSEEEDNYSSSSFKLSSSSSSLQQSSDSHPGVVVGPLLQTMWSQGTPYSTKLDESQKEFGVLGDLNGKGICGIVGWAQIMRYHKYPARGVGHSEPRVFKEVNLPSINFEVNFDWDNMLYDYKNVSTEQQRNNVAELYYIISIGGVDGNVSKTTNNFGYDKSIQRIYRRYYDDATWESILKAQLDAGLPVGYQGRGNASHFFVIDGYDKEGKFHVNWGWGGKHNGYYSINNLNPGEFLFNLYSGHSMFINFMPNKGGIEGYALALDTFATSKTSIRQNEPFTVVAKINPQGTLPAGQVAVALVDNGGNIAALAGVTSFKRNLSIIGYVPENIKPGQYSLRIVARQEGKNWEIVKLSNYFENIPNSINITVTSGEANGDGYGLSLENFSPEKTSVHHKEQFNVAIKARNIKPDAFIGGQLGVALVNNSGNIVEVIKSVDWDALNSNSVLSTTIHKCSIPDTIPPGQYRLRIVVKQTGSEEWRIATMSLADVPTSINFTLLEDI